MKVLFQRIALICALAAVVIWGVGKLLGWFANPDGFARLEILLGMLLAMVSALTLYEILRSFEKSEDKAEIDTLKKGNTEILELVRRDHLETLEALNQLAKSLRRNIDVSKSPSSLAEYIEIWSGFTENYWAYNPSYYQLEKRPGLDLREIVTQVHVPRFKNAGFKKAFYLFLTADAAGKNDLDEFFKIVHMAEKLYSDVRQKIEVRQRTDKASADDGEVYRGTKNGVVTSVLKPRERAFTGAQGNPLFYLIVTDSDINARLTEQFDGDWSQATEVAVPPQAQMDAGDSAV